MRSKHSFFTFFKLLLVFSFLLSVPEVHLPGSTSDVLTKITKLEIADLVLNAPAKVKGTQSQKIKKSNDTKFITSAFGFDTSLLFQKQIFPDISFELHADCCMAVLARAPPIA